MYLKPNGARSPPLLHAASHGQREMVGWLLSEEPLKLYKEFSKSKMADEDPRLQDLKVLPSRFEAMVSKWLGDRSKHIPIPVLLSDFDVTKHGTGNTNVHGR